MTTAAIKQPSIIYGLFDTEPKSQLLWLRDNNKPNLSCQLSFASAPKQSSTPTVTPGSHIMKKRLLASQVDGSPVNSTKKQTTSSSQLENSQMRNSEANRVVNQMKENVSNILANNQSSKIVIDQETQPNLMANYKNQGTLNMVVDPNVSLTDNQLSVHDSTLDRLESEEDRRMKQMNQVPVNNPSHIEDNVVNNSFQEKFKPALEQRYNVGSGSQEDHLNQSAQDNSLIQKFKPALQQKYNIPVSSLVEREPHHDSINQSVQDNSLMQEFKPALQKRYNIPNHQSQSQEDMLQTRVFSNKDDISLTDSESHAHENKMQIKSILNQEVLAERRSHEQSRSGSRKTSQRSNMFDGSEHDQRVVFEDDSNRSEVNELIPNGINKLSSKGESMVINEEPSYFHIECNGVATVDQHYTCNGKSTMKIVVKNYVGRKEYTVKVKEAADKELLRYLIGDLKQANLDWNSDSCVLTISSSKIFSMIVVAVVALFAL